MEDVRRFHGKRTIYVYLEIRIFRKQSFRLDPPHIIKHLLCTSNGECRNHQIASLRKGCIDHLGKFDCVIRRGFMVSITVGRLHDHIIRVLDKLRILDERPVVISDISGESKLHRLVIFRHPDFNGRGSEQMPRIDKANGQTLTDFNPVMILTRHKMFEHPLCIFHVVHRCHFRFTGTSCFTVSPFCLKFLNVRGILEHNITQFTGCLCCKNPAPESMIV